ncbi:MAG: PDDEXK nuclease domain-containing protein (plasmid) [Candidatus Algichlamydia australiensis]|nr:PDDEXK nuclease domain-containing protein [Chlamydiales bacterium]
MALEIESSSVRDLPEGYIGLLKEVKAKVSSAQLKAAIAVNSELIKLYWDIGKSLSEKQAKEKWGAKVTEKLAKDLKNAFPSMKGFSLTNIKYMVQFAEAYPDMEFSQQAVGQIPWGHNILIIQRLKSSEERLWYVNKTIENGWSRKELLNNTASKLHLRQGGAVTNFKHTLPSSQSGLAEQTLKDPYCFDFLTLRKEFEERELEEGLLTHIQKFLVELGTGFAFVGRQFHLRVDDKDYYIDLLFYHLKLRCYCVIDLKAQEFKPEHAGKMNFYLSAIDDLVRHPEDRPSIGMILCKTKKNFTVEYALRDLNKPIGVSGYEAQIVDSLPENLKGTLPTIEEIQSELKDSKEVNV